MNNHRPSQLIIEGGVSYFITGRTYGGISHLAGDTRKILFKNVANEKANKFKAEIRHWVIISNHYHLLVEFMEGKLLPNFMKELHGTSSFLVKKSPVAEVLNDEQVFLREITPLEVRNGKRIENLWRRLKPATTKNSKVVANFSSRFVSKVVANFSSRFAKILEELNFSQDVRNRLKSVNTERMIFQSIMNNDYNLFSTLVVSNMPEIPFWYNYFSHAIRNEKDYYCHFNYITQNPIKHGLVKNLWDYSFSGVFDYTKDYILDCLRSYPIIDFGGSYS